MSRWPGWGVLPGRVTAAIPTVEVEQPWPARLRRAAPREKGSDDDTHQRGVAVGQWRGQPGSAGLLETDGPLQYQQLGDTNEALLGLAGEAMLDAAQLRPGERVLDVGCGFGTSTLEAAERVAPSGRVVGVDISAAMLQRARQQSLPKVWTTSSYYTRMPRRTHSRPDHSTLSSAGSG